DPHDFYGFSGDPSVAVTHELDIPEAVLRRSFEGVERGGPSDLEQIVVLDCLPDIKFGLAVHIEGPGTAREDAKAVLCKTLEYTMRGDETFACTHDRVFCGSDFEPAEIVDAQSR